MASSNQPKPGRALGVLGLIVIALAATMIATGQYVPKLGLDLAGGTTVTLTPKTQQGKEPPESHIKQAVEIIRQRVNGYGVSEAEVTQQGDNIVVSIPGAGQKEVVQKVGQTAQLRFRQVLLVKSAKPAPTPSPTSSSSGSASPKASPSGDGGNADKSVSQSGNSDGSGDSGSDGNSGDAPSQGRAVSAVLQQTPDEKSGSGPGSDSSDSGAAPTPAPSGSPKISQEMLQRLQQQAAGQQTAGIDKEVLQKFRNFKCEPGASRGRLLPTDQQVVACNQDGTAKYVLSEVALKGTTVTDAQAALSQQGSWMVTLDFNSEGTKKWADFTSKVSSEQPPRNRVAIVLDGVIVSAPTVQGPIPGGQTQITGNFSQQQAQDLATILSYGSLPLKFAESEIQEISPTLGANSLRAGLIAGALGLLLVAVYSLLYYRALGFVSIIGLLLAFALSYAAIVVLGMAMGYRLSLAGVAGLIVSVGITVDSFVVYFERLRDEIREGRSPRAAVERSWAGARRTILTADAVQVLAAAVLWFLAVGGVKGFAFTLGLTTILDTIVVFLFTKPILTVIARTRFFGDGHPLSGLNSQRLGARRTSAKEAFVRSRTRGSSTPREA